MKIEKIVEPFYQALAEHRILARKCKECGAIEYPPHYACNTCGYHETEWVELSGRGVVHSIILPSTLNADPWNASLGSYGYGLIELEEGVMFNATIYGVNKKKAKKLRPLLPVPVHPMFVDKDGVTVVFFEVEDVEEK